jgi:deoxyribodipyrimidine photo-lyase
VVEQEFQPDYRGTIPWNQTEAAKTALYEARTGYPVIDAALRELIDTGFMHNRARMIVASFFTKDLLLDWRIGEEFFAQYLMDYELASNNGGWQWSASTGTDAQPYFRVFNPLLQSERFDPKGEYIRRYLPMLKDVPTEDIHWPHGTLYCPKAYPAPIVDHATAKKRAVEVFKQAKGALNALDALP